LHVEHRAWQWAQARKGVLVEQIRLLKSAELEKTQSAENNASRAIDSLLTLEKEKSKLQSELSQCIERSQAELRESQGKLLSVGKKLRESKQLMSKFKKQCNWNATK